jgi:transcriptional regulator with XRE-family HTH domain
MTLEVRIVNGIVIPVYERTAAELKQMEKRAANRPTPEPITPYEPPLTVAFLIRQGIRQTRQRQEDVAGIVGVTRRTFRSWLDNRIIPNEAHLDALAEVLQLDRESRSHDLERWITPEREGDSMTGDTRYTLTGPFGTYTIDVAPDSPDTGKFIVVTSSGMGPDGELENFGYSWGHKSHEDAVKAGVEQVFDCETIVTFVTADTTPDADLIELAAGAIFHAVEGNVRDRSLNEHELVEAVLAAVSGEIERRALQRLRVTLQDRSKEDDGDHWYYGLYWAIEALDDQLAALDAWEGGRDA